MKYLNREEGSKFVWESHVKLSPSDWRHVCDVAEKLHEERCHSSHINYCGWYYEGDHEDDNKYKVGVWQSWTHAQYFYAAVQLLAITTEDIIFKVLECL